MQIVILIILTCHFNTCLALFELTYKLSVIFADIIKYHFLTNKVFSHILSHHILQST